MLNKLRLLALPVLILSLLAAFAPAASAAPSAPQAKKAEAGFVLAEPIPVPTTDPTVIQPDIHPAQSRLSTSATLGPFLAARAYKDAYLKGGIVQTMIASYGACDSTGYRWTLSAWNSTLLGPVKASQLVSSFYNARYPGSRCNRVTVVSATSPARTWSSCITSLTLDHMGPPWNDGTHSYAVRYDPYCPRV